MAEVSVPSPHGLCLETAEEPRRPPGKDHIPRGRSETGPGVAREAGDTIHLPGLPPVPAQ